MAYTRGWDATAPVGSRAANEIDDIIRELKVDLQERLLAKLFGALPNTTVEADVTVRAEILGNVTGKTIGIHHCAFMPNEDDDDIERTSAYTESDNDSGSEFRCPVVLPQGVTITGVTLLCDKNGGTSVTATLYKINPTTGAVTNIGASFSRSSSGIGLASSAVLSEVVAGSFYGILVTHSPLLVSRMRIYGATITYTTPDCRNTI